jgi:uncharacterized protein YebE (UPF0316 family)
VLQNATALPFLIFVAELAVVTCGTLRIIFVARGRKLLSPILGFFEVSIWLFAITQIMQNLNNPWCYLAFAAGYAAGNYMGVLIEQKLAMGTMVVRTITPRHAGGLINGLKHAGYGVTSVDARGATGPVQIILTVVPRKELKSVVGIIKAFDPRAFYSIDELQAASSGIFPARLGSLRQRTTTLLLSVPPTERELAAS